MMCCSTSFMGLASLSAALLYLILSEGERRGYSSSETHNRDNSNGLAGFAPSTRFPVLLTGTFRPAILFTPYRPTMDNLRAFPRNEFGSRPLDDRLFVDDFFILCRSYLLIFHTVTQHFNLA